MPRPFDERARLCDNPGVTHLRTVVSCFVLAGASLVAACAQPNDVPALQEEAQQTAKSYQDRFADLAERAHAIKPGELSPDALRVYSQVEASLARYRNDLNQLPTRIATGVKNGPTDLYKLLDSMHGHFEAGVIETNAQLNAIDTQMTALKQSPPVVAAAPAAGDQPTDASGNAVR
jgi:hypothetical protein